MLSVVADIVRYCVLSEDIFEFRECPVVADIVRYCVCIGGYFRVSRMSKLDLELLLWH
jgi:hypothetical protein